MLRGVLFARNALRVTSNHTAWVRGIALNLRNMSSICAGQRRFLVYFAQEHVEFRFSELRSLCTMLQISLDERELIRPQSPFLLLTLDNEDQARALVRRSVLMRSCFECWAHATSFADLLKDLPSLPPRLINKYSDSSSSYRLRVHAYGKKLRFEDIKQRIQELQVFPLNSTVNLVDPIHSFHLLEDYGGNDVPESETPERIFFARWLADGGRDAIHHFRLDQRYFIGTTSMDPCLALVMANQALISPGDFVYDPFVGTGSLLIAAAHFGALTMGADIDQTLLHGRGKSTRAKNTWRKRDESVEANFKQYGLHSRYLDVLIADATKNVLHDDVRFDAILADPPYGVREATSQVGKSRHEDGEELLVRRLELGKCDLNSLIVPLINFAAMHLRIGGRLVYWLPVLTSEYNESAVPRHECLQVMSNSEQRLAGLTSRRLITMEKTKSWKSEYRTTFAMDIYTSTFRERYFTAQRNICNREKQQGIKPEVERKTSPTRIRQ